MPLNNMKIGYKATYNMKCLNLTYEVGKTYTIDNMQLCSHGFHFCKVAKHVLQYYSYTKDFILLELEILGDVINDNDILVNPNKSVTNKIKVNRIIPRDEYTNLLGILLDANGDIIPIPNKESDDSGLIWKYDDGGNVIYHKSLLGHEYHCKYEYDEKGNMIYQQDFTGSIFHWKYKYDEKGNIIYQQDSKGNEYHWIYEYDEKGNMTYRKISTGLEQYWTYDEKGNAISLQSADVNWTITIE